MSPKFYEILHIWYNRVKLRSQPLFCFYILNCVWFIKQKLWLCWCAECLYVSVLKEKEKEITESKRSSQRHYIVVCCQVPQELLVNVTCRRNPIFTATSLIWSEHTSFCQIPASPWIDTSKTPDKIDQYDVRRRPWWVQLLIMESASFFCQLCVTSNIRRTQTTSVIVIINM